MTMIATRRLLLTGATAACAAPALAQQRGTQPAARPAPAPRPAPTPEELSRAPFGLKWGASTDELREQEIQLAAATGAGNWGASFRATGLNQALQDAEFVLLSFGHRDRLWRIASAGNVNQRDPYGSTTAARYQELSQALSARYGAGRETDTRDTQVWKNPNEYVMSLSTGRAFRYTIFDTPVVNVELSMRGRGNDNSNWLIIFSSKAEETLFNEDKARRERDSL